MADEPPRVGEAGADASRNQVKAAVDQALQAVENIADPEVAYFAAKKLVEALREATNVAGRLHARAAERIHNTRKLSYAKLGALLGVGKARAEQLVKAARAERKGDDAGAKAP